MVIYVIWLLLVIAFWVLIWKLTRNWQSLPLGIARALLRTLAIAVALSPTVIVAGYVVLPWLATAAIFFYAFDGHWSEVQRQVRQSLFHFFTFWAISFLIAVTLFLWKYYRRTKNNRITQGKA